MTTKKHIEPDAFIRPAMDALDVPLEDEALFRKFVERNVGKLDELWAVFLEEEAYDRLMARTPSLRTLIRHTTLSIRTKNALERNHMETVGQLAQYSPAEIRRFRGVGEGVLAEITEYMVSIGFPLPAGKS